MNETAFLIVRIKTVNMANAMLNHGDKELGHDSSIEV